MDEVELTIKIGQATNEDGMTLVGVIEEDIEVSDKADFVEPEIVDHVWDKYNVEIDQ